LAKVLKSTTLKIRAVTPGPDGPKTTGVNIFGNRCFVSHLKTLLLTTLKLKKFFNLGNRNMIYEYFKLEIFSRENLGGIFPNKTFAETNRLF